MDAWLVTILKEGGTAAIAAVALWILNRVWNDRLVEAKRNGEALQQLTAQLRETIEENTRVISIFLDRYGRDDRKAEKEARYE